MSSIYHFRYLECWAERAPLQCAVSLYMMMQASSIASILSHYLSINLWLQKHDALASLLNLG